ncbi:MAG: VWA domain-containing protein [Fusobacteriaceae bacterium]
MFKFASPWFLFLIPVIIFLFFFLQKFFKKRGISVPSIIKVKSKSLKTKKHLVAKYLFFLSSISIVLALANPKLLTSKQGIKKNGIDIVITLDLSQSMTTEDFKPNRMEKAKELLLEFVSKRSNDRLGLVIFGGDAYTKVPLTFDHNVIKDIISKVSLKDISNNNRTAIGMGLGVAINRVKNSEAKSKIIILMTDGENNFGEMSPTSAAMIAKELGIKVYTIGIGAREILVPDFFGMRKIQNVALDEGLLEYIAKETGGQYFRATNTKDFRQIFEKLDALEKTRIDSEEFFTEKDYFEIFLKIALILLLLGIIFEYLIFIKIP